jgi:hypothetical protein
MCGALYGPAERGDRGDLSDPIDLTDFDPSGDIEKELRLLTYRV